MNSHTYISISVSEPLRVGCCVILICDLSIIPKDLRFTLNKWIWQIILFLPYSVAYRLSRFSGNVEGDDLISFCHISCNIGQA